MWSVKKSLTNACRVEKTRRGAVLVLAAACLVMVFAFAAFSIDAAYISMVATELQNAADSSALAGIACLADGPAAVLKEIQETAEANQAAGKPVMIKSSDVQFGRYDTDSRSFTIDNVAPNAIRVTTRVRDQALFFAPVLGRDDFSIERSAVAMLNPRDICFVVDLSGSMNNDTEPAWATECIEDEFGPQGYSGTGNQLMQQVYDDFGYGSFPGPVQYIGSPLGVAANNLAYAQMTKDNGPLTSGSIASTYRISNNDTEATRKTKAYRWIIDKQIAVIMPGVKPSPNSSNSQSLAYWTAYLDYIMEARTLSNSSNAGKPRRGSNSNVTLPPSQNSNRIDGFGNPDRAQYPSSNVSLPRSWRNKIGYRTYVQFMMDFGRDRTPTVSNGTNASPSAGYKVPLSTLSPDCPWHSEETAGGTFDFPPREQPTHAVRRALIAALQQIKEKNLGLGEGVGDWVSIVTFDADGAYHSPQVLIALTPDYDAAMQASTGMQAVGDIGSSTATENGIIKARQHLRPQSQGGIARNFTTKVVVLLTDGIPNLYESSSTTISRYLSQNPDSNFYSSSSSNNAYNSALMQTSQMQAEHNKLFAVGMGLGADMDFMDRLARMGRTAQNGQSPRGAGNPASYEQQLTSIFEQIINTRGGKLVK